MLYSARAQLSGEGTSPRQNIERRRVDGGIFENLVREADGQKRHACRSGHERSLVRLDRTESFATRIANAAPAPISQIGAVAGRSIAMAKPVNTACISDRQFSFFFIYQQRDCLNGDRAYNSRKYRPECERAP